jgi:MFS family permease
VAAVAAAAVGFGALDFGFLSTAGPAIGADLGLGDAYPWLFSAGSFAFAAALPLVGGILGHASPARVLRLGAAGAALGYAFLILAPGAPAGIAARMVTGAGGAAMLPAALAVLGAAGASGGFARSGGAVAAGFASGALLGGVAAELTGWRIAAAAVATLPLVLAWRQNAQSVLSPRQKRQTFLSLPEGTMRLSAAMVACAAALWLGSRPLGIGAAVIGASAVAAGVRGGSLPGARRTAQVCALGFATTASGVGATALLGAVLARAGAPVLLGAFGLAVPLAVGLAARVSTRHGAAGCATIGLLVQGGALLGLAPAVAGSAAATVAPAPGAVVAALLVFGLGHVLANAGAVELAVHGAGAATGPAASLLGSSQYAGGAIGSLVVFSAAGAGIADPAAGLAAACLLAAGGAGFAVIAAGRPSERAVARTPRPR